MTNNIYEYLERDSSVEPQSAAESEFADQPGPSGYRADVEAPMDTVDQVFSTPRRPAQPAGGPLL